MATTNKSFSDWLDNTAKAGMRLAESSILSIQKEAVGNTRQDMSRPILEQLLENGYDLVEWDSGHTTCGRCLELDNQKWTLEDFLTGLDHDAPIFERSHPGDESCSVIVTGPELQPIRVDSYGNTEEV